MGNVIFIVWRESVEAMLVIGILYAWLAAREQAKEGMRYLWGGVGAGLGLAAVLAAIMLFVQSELADEAREYFEIAIVFIASGLITQMVLWMRRHGRTLKRELESSMEEKVRHANWWGIVALVAIAVGREGAETVVFLYGIGLEKSGVAFAQFVMAAAGGFGLALLTFWALSRGSRFVSWALFFRFSEIVLLLLAAALLANGAERMISAGLLPPLVDPLWDSSALLDDSGATGSLVASLTGYRAHPTLMLLLVYVAYWAAVWALMRGLGKARQPSIKQA